MAEIEIREVVEDGSAVAKALFRNTIVRRYAYAIADSEEPSDLNVNSGGVVPYYLLYGGRLFWLDATDSTSGPGDDVTLIVTADGYRYFSDGMIEPVWSVLTQGEDEPPASPSVGDAYHTGLSPTDDWAGEPNKLAIYTRRGWLFADIPVGRALLVVGEGSYYHMDDNGDFVLGMGTATVGANTVRDTMLIGGQRFFTVENQSVTSPPSVGTAPLGTYWIVGGGATGAWAGQDGKIVTSYDATNWTFLSPVEGWHAYDKALNSLFKFNGTLWQNANGAYIKTDSDAENGNLTLNVSGIGAGYTYSNTTAPTISANANTLDPDVSVSLAAEKTGTVIEVEYVATAVLSIGTSLGSMNVGLFRDSETSAIDWQLVMSEPVSFTNNFYGINVKFRITAIDTANHSYHVRIFLDGSGNTNPNVGTISRRRMFLREVA